jgi:hypothetical protein
MLEHRAGTLLIAHLAIVLKNLTALFVVVSRTHVRPVL